MPKANIYQIFYNQQTQESLDKGFIPLNNLQNSRPDWGEFWVIRNFLLNNDLKEDEWYGFLSPKFHEKTGLNSTQVHQFIKSISADTEIILLSPFWELIAFFPNTFSQGEFWHPGLTAVAQNFFNAIDEPKNIKNLIMHSGNTVYCNYFLAKPSFWRSWLSIGNQLFDFSENKNHPLHQQLNTPTSHNSHNNYTFKIFIQERLASYLLVNKNWNRINYPLSSTNSLISDIALFKDELISCDALKFQYSSTGHQVYLDEYLRLKNEISRRVNIKSPE